MGKVNTYFQKSGTSVEVKVGKVLFERRENHLFHLGFRGDFQRDKIFKLKFSLLSAH